MDGIALNLFDSFFVVFTNQKKKKSLVDDATDVCPDFDRKETLDLAKAVKNQQQAATAVEQGFAGALRSLSNYFFLAVQAKEDAFQRYVSVQQLWKGAEENFFNFFPTDFFCS